MPDARSPPPTPAPSGAEFLAARLAARILHDISGPASAIVSGLDLLADPGQPDDGALDLASSSAMSLLALIEFHKLAFGSGTETIGGADLLRLALAPFEGRRPRLEWASELDAFSGMAAQTTLIFLQIAAGALPLGGVARVTASAGVAGTNIRVEGKGPRVSFYPETLDGLAGRDFAHGLTGQWAPARYLHARLTGGGGVLTAEADPGRFTLTAAIPAASPMANPLDA
jgi:histidine phosphotransferase ChpT